jgi:hypothetical protein
MSSLSDKEKKTARRVGGWAFALGIIVILIGILVVQEKNNKVYLCIAGGYADHIRWNRTDYCIGTELGMPTVERLESVREAIEALE